MGSKRSPWTLSSCFLVLAAAAGQEIQPSVVDPPRTARIEQTILTPSPFAPEKLAGEVRIFTNEKRLAIRWSRDDAGTRAFHLEEFGLDYWPTAAARISDARLTDGTHFLVAGKRPLDGRTLLERWDLGFDGIPSDATPTRVTKSVLFDASVAGKQVVRMMTPVNGIQGAAFVHFEDSNDLYRVDASTGALALLLTPKQVPCLGHDSYVFWSGGKLASGAYCYLYQCDFAQDDDGALLMYDLDGNGTIDETTAVPKEQWSVVERLQWVERYNH